MRIGFEKAVKSGPSFKSYPKRQEAAVSLVSNGADRFLDFPQSGRYIVNPREVRGNNGPPRVIEDQALNADNMAVCDVDYHRPLRPKLADAAALQIAWKHDPRLAGELFVFMDVTESPILVAAAREVRRGARRIHRVSRASITGR